VTGRTEELPAVDTTRRRIETGPDLTVVVTGAKGRLRVEGWDKSAVIAEGDDVEMEDRGDEVHVSCGRGCRLRVPTAARLRLQVAHGGARLAGLSAPAAIESVAGDLAVRDVGDVDVESVGGTLRARGVTGHLRAGRVGGSLVARGVTGDVAATAVGGRLRLEATTGQVMATCGGNAALDLASSLAGDWAVSAGGDVALRLPAAPDAILRIRSGAGRIRFPGEARVGDHDGPVVERTLGEGNHHVDVTAGGTVTILDPQDADGGDGDEESLGEGFAAMTEEFAVQIESGLGGLSDRLGKHLDRIASSLPEVLHSAGLGEGDVDRITDRVRRAGERAATQAERRAEQAARRAERKIARRLAAARRRMEEPGEGSASAAPRDGERATILRMLEDGRIDADEAEKLLSALDQPTG